MAGDERIKQFKTAEKASKNKKRYEKEAAEKKAKEDAAAAKLEAERVVKEKEEAEKADREKGKKAKEAAKNAAKKNKRVLKGSVKDANYLQEGGSPTPAQIDGVLNEVDLVMSKVDNEELAAMAANLTGKTSAVDVKAVWVAEVTRLMKEAKIKDGEVKYMV
jgi:DnaJ family protein C protein 2